MSATATDIAAIIERSKPGVPRKCHTIDHRGYPLCGEWKPMRDGDRQRDTSGVHSRSECEARGHKYCPTCKELSRQLGHDFMAG